ncbi:hypothetical protein ABT150_46835 [Streptomyces mirabilis]|uniref:hypothetical protein n=1 Tax=Streptomyces mirabilis TaxID=68239 RepID=UPI00331DF2AA
MRLRRTALCATLAACLTGRGAVYTGVRVARWPPTDIPWSGLVFVEDWDGRPRQHPQLMYLTEITALAELEWQHWGSPQARADSVALDLNCVSGSPDDQASSYRVEVVLSDLTKRQGAAYCRHAAVTPGGSPAPFWAEDLSNARLGVPKA